MATATQELPPLPKPDVPFAKVAADNKSMLVDPDWYRYMRRLDQLIRALRLEIP